MGGGLCRQHAIVLEMELEDGATADRIVGVIDRSLVGRAPFVTIVTGVLNGFLGHLFVSGQAQARAQQPASSPPPSRSRAAGPPPPRSAPPPPRPQAREQDPRFKARELLGFEPAETLTKERVNKRRQSLAKVFHPDLGVNGSDAQMKRVNAAADLLLANLA